MRGIYTGMIRDGNSEEGSSMDVGGSEDNINF